MYTPVHPLHYSILFTNIKKQFECSQGIRQKGEAWLHHDYESSTMRSPTKKGGFAYLGDATGMQNK